LIVNIFLNLAISITCILFVGIASTNEAFKVTDLAYTTDGRRLITADLLKYICLYNVDKEYTLLRMLPNCISMPGSIAISPDLTSSSFAVIGPAPYLITVYEGSTLNELLRIDITDSSSGSSEGAVRLGYAPADLGQLLCATSQNRLVKFEAKSGRQVGQSVQRIHKGGVDALAVSGCGRFIVTSGDNLVKVWDYEMRFEKSFQAFIGHSAPVSCILFTPDSGQVRQVSIIT
jgi:WD40 repeat protein